MREEDLGVEERVRELLRRSDHPIVIRPLDLSRPSGSAVGPVLAAVSFVLVIVVAGVLAIGTINARRQPVAASPQVTATAPAEQSPTPRASASFSADFSSADDAAAAVRYALERPDAQLLLGALAPSGWYARWYEQTQTEPMSRSEAWNWILNSTSGRWEVDAATLRDADASMPPGEKYVSATAVDFGGWPEQRAAIMLQSVGGRWYWSSLLLFRPPPIQAAAGEVAGYATLITVTDTTVIVRFRTGGSRCCSDQSWDGRTTVLRRDASTVYMGAGGTTATSLADASATVGTDVWVHFSLDTMLSDGSYRLVDLVKMYP